MPPNFQPPTSFSPQPVSPAPIVPTAVPPVVPPTIPPVQPKPEASGHNKSTQIILLALAVLIILGGVYYALQYSSKDKASQPVPADFSNEKVMLNKNSGVPAGFPDFIPVEVSAITDSSTLDYPDRGVTLYSLTIRTSQQPEYLFNTYSSAINKAGFVITKLNRNSFQSSIESTLGERNLSVTIVPQAVGAIIQIAYSENK